MDDEKKENQRPVNPRRRKRSKMRIFKEVYLPVIILGLAAVLLLSFVIGTIVRSVQKGKVNKQAGLDASISASNEEARLAEECQTLLSLAEAQAQTYDYAGAVAILDSFSGDMTKYPELTSQREVYVNAQSSLVAWEDPSQVMNLSFQLLVADPSRAFSHAYYGTSFKNNFITTDEFSRILQQLYENGFILVDMDDFITVGTAADGSATFTPKPLMLPNGKKPLMLTQTNVNYNLYLIDSDQDMLPDKDGGGFASKLMLDAAGNFTCEMVDNAGQTVTGSFDLVPILDAFVESHPDFSYKGAKAVLALTGYNGLFGYRTHPAGKEKFGADAHAAAIEDAKRIAAALENRGYKLACYTYENIGYGESGLTEIQADLESWKAEVEPILGPMDMLVYAQMSDITTEAQYTGEKYEALKNAGFKYYLGICDEGKQAVHLTSDYVRQGRLMVTGKNLSEHGDWFAPYFDAALVRDNARGI